MSRWITQREQHWRLYPEQILIQEPRQSGYWFVSKNGLMRRRPATESMFEYVELLNPLPDDYVIEMPPLTTTMFRQTLFYVPVGSCQCVRNAVWIYLEVSR